VKKSIVQQRGAWKRNFVGGRHDNLKLDTL